jgi:hypothetical protein
MMSLIRLLLVVVPWRCCSYQVRCYCTVLGLCCETMKYLCQPLSLDSGDQVMLCALLSHNSCLSLPPPESREQRPMASGFGQVSDFLLDVSGKPLRAREGAIDCSENGDCSKGADEGRGAGAVATIR